MLWLGPTEALLAQVACVRHIRSRVKKMLESVIQVHGTQSHFFRNHIGFDILNFIFLVLFCSFCHTLVQVQVEAIITNKLWLFNSCLLHRARVLLSVTSQFSIPRNARICLQAKLAILTDREVLNIKCFLPAPKLDLNKERSTKMFLFCAAQHVSCTFWLILLCVGEIKQLYVSTKRDQCDCNVTDMRKCGRMGALLPKFFWIAEMVDQNQ